MASVTIGGRPVGPGYPTLMIAELSANHGGNLERALETIRLAAASGADAIKLQTYTADTMTIPCANKYFRVRGGLWDGYTLYDLYREAHTPWEWHAALFDEAKRCGLMCFSTPFDSTAVDFLEQFDPPCYKLASFEIVDLPLIRSIAATGRPVIFSTGMSHIGEIAEAISTFRAGGSGPLVGLRCVSAYPADPGDFNLRSIPALAEAFNIVVGLSDHSLGSEVSIAAVALGANVIEKHFIRSRQDGGPDSAFSVEPHEFSQLVTAVRRVEAATARADFAATESEQGSLVFRRSIFAVADIVAGQELNADNVRVIRPGNGLHPRELPRVMGRCAVCAIPAGTPLSWDLVGGPVHEHH